MLTLASAGWAQSAMLGCPMALAAAGIGMAGQAASDEHLHHTPHLQVDQQSSAVADSSEPGSEPSCTMPVGCGAAGVTAPRAVVSSAGPPTNEAPGPSTAIQYTTVFLSHEPPPPRLPV